MAYPDIQYHFLPVAIRYDGKAPAKAHGFQAHVGPMRSASRGEVKLKSTDPRVAPSISSITCLSKRTGLISVTVSA